MLETIKLLVKLQELDLILAEVKIVHKKEKNTDSIKEKVKSIREQIDLMILSRYDRLARQGLAVVQEIDGRCLGCNLSIPVGDLNRIKAQKMDSICPNCGKFLVITSVREEIIRETKTESDTGITASAQQGT